MDLTRLFSRAWQITWRHRALWAFGLLIAIFEGGVNCNFNSGSGGGPVTPGGAGGQFPELSAPVVALIIAAGLVIFLLLFVLSIAGVAVGRGGIIGGAAAADDGAQPSLGDSWRLSREHLPGLVVLQLLTIPVFIIIVVVAAAAVAAPIALAVSVGQRDQSAFWIGVLIAVLLLLIVFAFAFVVAIVVRLLLILASLAVVFERQNAIEAIRSAIRLVRLRPGPVLLLWLVLGIVGFVVSFVAAIPLVVVGFAFVIGSLTQPTLLPIFLLIALPALALALVIGSIWQTFRITAWTLAYRDWRLSLVTAAGPMIGGPAASRAAQPAPPVIPVVDARPQTAEERPEPASVDPVPSPFADDEAPLEPETPLDPAVDSSPAEPPPIRLEKRQPAEE